MPNRSIDSPDSVSPMALALPDRLRLASTTKVMIDLNDIALALKVSRRTAERRVIEKGFPAVHVFGNKRRWFASEFNKWLDRHGKVQSGAARKMSPRK